MIKKYSNYIKESLLDKLQGPTIEDTYNYYLNKGNLILLFNFSLNNFILKGVKYCIDSGYSVNKFKWEIVRTFNDYAKEMYDSGIIQYLYDNGLDISGNGYKIFRDCCYHGYTDLVKKMLENGIPEEVFTMGSLYQAAMNGYLDVVKLLHNYGADIHIKQDAPLRFSAVMGHKDVVEYCLQFGIINKEKVIDTLDEILEEKHYEIYDIIKKYLEDNGGYLKESLLNKISGPSQEEIIKNLNDKPIKLLKYAYETSNKKLLDETKKLITIEDKDYLIDNIIETIFYYISDIGYDNLLYYFEIPDKFFEYNDKKSKDENDELLCDNLYEYFYSLDIVNIIGFVVKNGFII